MEREIDISDLEEEYEEKISKEFNTIIDAFQKKNSMDSTSMIRLLSKEVVDYTNKIDILGK